MAKTSAPFGHPFGRPRHWIASGRMASATHTNNSSRSHVLSVGLMADQHGFGDNAMKSTRRRQSDHREDQMNEYDSEVAHSGNRINSSKNDRTRANLTTCTA